MCVRWVYRERSEGGAVGENRGADGDDRGRDCNGGEGGAALKSITTNRDEG